MKLIVIIILIFCSVACTNDSIFRDNFKVPDSEWHINNKANFKVNIEDNTIPYNVNINVRHNTNYRYRNIFLFINITDPKGKNIQDTANLILADSKGKWLGSGLGDLRSITYTYRNRVLFPENGEYSFVIEHGMRDDYLKNISDLGLAIEKTK